MSDLPWEIVEDILGRIPLTSIRILLLTCKKWNNLLKDGSFTKKHLLSQEAASRDGGKFMAMMMFNYDLFLASFDFRGIYNIDSNETLPFINLKAKLISLDDSYKAEISRVCHCDGLLLCTTKDYNWLVVWNPYTCQTRWICVESKSLDDKGKWYSHTLGYDKSKSSRTYKILGFSYYTLDHERFLYEIYDLNSNSWRVFNVSRDWRILFHQHGVSLKGNTYWLAYENEIYRDLFLLSFDFTREIFIPNLPFPFHRSCPYNRSTVILSSLREEQLAMLLVTFKMEIWVTTKIEPNVVSWSNFFVIDTEPLRDFGSEYLPYYSCRSFLIDEEKKAVIIFDRLSPTHITVYIFGENGYFKKVELGKLKIELDKLFDDTYPHACSYVPSVVQINQTS